MLTREQNEILTRVGPGTPMGDVLRRYWLPVCLSSELAEPDGPPVRVPILGEQLVAFRDSAGQVGLIQEFCPHRGASLFYGRNEACGLRCTYHGWKFDVTGQCVDQRSELHPFAHRIKITSYPVHEGGGIVWAYLGPAGTMTPFRNFGTQELAPEHIAASKEPIACNWVQSMDGDLDTVHISNLHQFDALTLGGPPFYTVPGYPFETNPRSGVIERKYTLQNDYLIDRQAQKTESFSGIRDFRSQDLMVTESAGPVYDRTREHLGSGDVAVVRFHRQLLAAARGLTEGRLPPALSGDGDFRRIRGAEKILEEDEDWRILGTDDDPALRGEVLAGAPGAGEGQS